MTEPRVQQSDVTLFRRQALSANVSRACRNCGAPGHWHDIPDVNPGCFDPEKARAAAPGLAPVGPICPQCGADRPELEAHGEIWAREWRPPSIVRQLLNLCKWRRR